MADHQDKPASIRCVIKYDALYTSPMLERVNSFCASIALFEVASFSRGAATADSLGREPQGSQCNLARKPRRGDSKPNDSITVAPPGLAPFLSHVSWDSRPRLPAVVPTGLSNAATSKLALWSRLHLQFVCFVTLCLIPLDYPLFAESEHESLAESGYRILRTKPFLPPDFDQQVFDQLWKVWPAPVKSRARAATPTERRRMAFSRYGLMEVPGQDSSQGPALGYVDDGKGGWVMNCLACHAGKVAGRVIPGLPNTHFALQTLVEDVKLTKLSLLKPFGHLDLASFKIPFGTTNGTTNAVVFGIALGNVRDRDMRVDRRRPSLKLDHHDLDAPPLWNFKKKRSLYCDGFAPKNHRVLMQFMLLPVYDAKTVYGWEPDFKAIQAWIESLQTPKYPWPIDQPLAAKGEALFQANCTRCHGTYGPGGQYKQMTISLEVVGTDPIRVRALNREHRLWIRDGWMSRYGKDAVDVEPAGYVAPPLDGIWATAPYFHNGSVPTLWHVFHPDHRPTVWKRTENGYDKKRVGLEINESDELPNGLTSAEKRRYFDTRQRGKSAAGHTFPARLTEGERRAVLEYLKSI